MKLRIFNGSPRGENSNSSLIIKWLVEGYQQKEERNQVSTFMLKRVEKHDEYAELLSKSDCSIIVFPLYVDAMPGIVKAFIEKLEPYKGKMNHLKLGFVVHSGFPEPHHSRFIEKYLVRLAEILEVNYIGTVVIGGSEGFRIMTEKMLREKRELLNSLGKSLTSEELFNKEIIKKLAPFEQMSIAKLTLYRLVSLTGLTNVYWDRMLKENNVIKDKNNKPYVL